MSTQPGVVQLVGNMIVFPFVIASGMVVAIPAMITTFISICAGHWCAMQIIHSERDEFRTVVWARLMKVDNFDGVFSGQVLA